MKLSKRLRIVSLIILILPLNSYAVDKTRFLQSIAEVETGNVYHKVGKRGERSKYQISKNTWYDYTSTPFKYASFPNYQSYSFNVALKHLNFLEREFSRRNIHPSVENYAMAWNAGIGALIRNRVPASSKNYAKRVNSLYHSW